MSQPIEFSGVRLAGVQRLIAFLAGSMVLLWLTGLAGTVAAQTPIQTAVERSGEALESAKASVQQSGEAVANKVDEVWRRIDERRLKNRTRDEIVAWVIIGLLVGNVVGLLSLLRTTLMQRLGIVGLGLAGAFLGGMVAHVGQLDFGLGPVLIRYEDLLLSMIGGLLLIAGARWFGYYRRKKNLARAAQAAAKT